MPSAAAVRGCRHASCYALKAALVRFAQTHKAVNENASCVPVGFPALAGQRRLPERWSSAAGRLGRKTRLGVFSYEDYDVQAQ